MNNKYLFIYIHRGYYDDTHYNEVIVAKSIGIAYGKFLANHIEDDVITNIIDLGPDEFYIEGVDY